MYPCPVPRRLSGVEILSEMPQHHRMDDGNDDSRWRVHMDAGYQAHAAGRYPQAEVHFAQALREAEELGSADPCLAQALSTLGTACQLQGKYSLAEDAFRRSLAIKERMYGEAHQDVAVDLHNLAVVLSAKGRFAEAEPLYRKAIAVRQKLSGENDPDLIAVLENYARLLRRSGREAEALALEARARLIAGPS